MIRICIILVIALYLSLYIPTNLQANWNSLDSTTHALISRGLNLTYINEYADALNIFEELITRHPNEPMGYLGAATVYQTILRNYRTRTYETAYDSLLSLSIRVGESAIRTDNNNVLAYLYLGGAYGYRGLYNMRKHQWYSALKDGWRGISRLKKCIDLDAELYDAYFGLGLYHYWRSAKANVLKFLPFVDSKQMGIDEIQLAIAKGRYSSVQGKFALIYVYYDEQQYDEALAIAHELHRLFPNNASCQYMLSRIYEQLGEWQKSRMYFTQLLTHLESSEYTTTGYLIECHYRLAQCLLHLGESDTALIMIEKAMLLRTHHDPAAEINGPLEDVDTIVEAAEKFYHEITSKPTAHFSK
ncbi:tetratricopeptide repeat protein [candidate division KSB1 bacterium]|nr:tetratricopeptide repeat protein [candidate division KSB1 bacterium]